jgi:uncharacterized protein YqfA (UPF0365 family)
MTVQSTVEEILEAEMENIVFQLNSRRELKGNVHFAILAVTRDKTIKKVGHTMLSTVCEHKMDDFLEQFKQANTVDWTVTEKGIPDATH